MPLTRYCSFLSLIRTVVISGCGMRRSSTNLMFAEGNPLQRRGTGPIEERGGNRDRKIIYALMACVAACIAIPSSADATVIPYLESQGSFGFSNTSSGNLVFPYANICDTYNSTANTPCSGSQAIGTYQDSSGTFIEPTNPNTVNYSTNASASYGVLHASASSNLTGSGTASDLTYTAETQAWSQFTDVWTITGGAGTAGTTGTLNLTFAVDGTYNYCDAGTGVGNAINLNNLNTYANSYATITWPSGCSGNIAQNLTVSTQFTFGQALPFDVSLTAESDLVDLGIAGVSSNMDLFNTATMTSLIVTNSQGQAVPFNLGTESGTSLFQTLAVNANTTPVPEPPTVALFGAGLCALGLIVWRRKKARTAA